MKTNENLEKPLTISEEFTPKKFRFMERVVNFIMKRNP